MNQFKEIQLRLRLVAVSVLTVFATGIIGYRVIEGWNFFDSLYMTVITLATVGYGETHPLSDPGRAFTIILIMTGIGVLTYAITTLTDLVVEGDLREALRRHRMDQKIEQLEGHYIVCGAGHVGRVILDELGKTSRTYVVVDQNEERVKDLQTKGVLVIQGDATEDAVLQRAGIERARGLFGALPNDPDNAFVAISARGLNAGLRIVLQEEGGAAHKLRRSGADSVVNPGSIGGLRMASEMIRPAAVGFLDSMLRAEGKVFRIEEVEVPAGSPLVGRRLEEVKGAQGNAALLLAVKNPTEKTYDINPEPARPIVAGEILVIMGNREHIQDLRKKAGVAGP